MNYPQINVNIQRKRDQDTRMMGINLTDEYQIGQMESCSNVSSKRYPYITTADKLMEVETGITEGFKPVSMYAWEKLFVVSNEPTDDTSKVVCVDGITKYALEDESWSITVDENGITHYNFDAPWGPSATNGITYYHFRDPEGYKCFYDGVYCGNAMSKDSNKQYAVINSKLVMYPDKVYFDLYDNRMKSTPLTTAELKHEISEGQVSYSNSDNGEGKITFPSADDNRIADGAIAYLADTREYLNDGRFTVKESSYSGGNITYIFDEPFTSEVLQKEFVDSVKIYDGTPTDTTSGNYVPDMDYICSNGNRMWGCSSKTRTVYVSALGDPTDFWTFAGDSLDAFQVAVGSAGNFTGCCSLNNSVLFFKQHTIHKMLGSYPAEYTLYSYELEGVSESNGKSISSVDGTALFVTEHGISRYSGASSVIASTELGQCGLENAIALYNGQNYFLYFTNEAGEGNTYSLDTRHNIWIQEAYGKVLEFAHLGDKDFVLVEGEDTNTIYHINTDIPTEDDWQITYKPYYEDNIGMYGSRTHIFEKKRYTGITLRVELPKGSRMKVEIKPDDKPWYTMARTAGKENKVQDLVLRTPRCDKLQLRLSGHGPMTILAMERQFTTGSRR